MNFVLDASVALSWCFEDKGGPYALSVLDALRSSEAVATAMWPFEVSNGLATAERRGRIDHAASARVGRLLLSLPVTLDPVARQRAFSATYPLARKHALTTYDAAYLELAVRIGVPLATIHVPLRHAARAEGVTLFAPRVPA